MVRVPEHPDLTPAVEASFWILYQNGTASLARFLSYQIEVVILNANCEPSPGTCGESQADADRVLAIPNSNEFMRLAYDLYACTIRSTVAAFAPTGNEWHKLAHW
jgi:hypothetical protein